MRVVSILAYLRLAVDGVRGLRWPLAKFLAYAANSQEADGEAAKRWEGSSLRLTRRCNVMLTVQYLIECLLASGGYVMCFGWQPSFVFLHHFALGAVGLPSSLAFAFWPSIGQELVKLCPAIAAFNSGFMMAQFNEASCSAFNFVPEHLLNARRIKLAHAYVRMLAVLQSVAVCLTADVIGVPRLRRLLRDLNEEGPSSVRVRVALGDPTDHGSCRKAKLFIYAVMGVLLFHVPWAVFGNSSHLLGLCRYIHKLHMAKPSRLSLISQ